MKVYRVHTLDDDFQMLTPVEIEGFLDMTGPNPFRGGSLAARWPPHYRCYVNNPKRKRGDFLGFASGTFAFTRRVHQEFLQLFQSVGEILPVDVDGETLYVLNVTRCIDAFDDQHGEPYTDRLAFFPEMLRDESLFFSRGDIALLTVSEHGRTETDFAMRVGELGLRGLSFQLVWEGRYIEH